MANKILLKRGLNADLISLATAGGLNLGEPYFITDQDRVAIGLTTSTYQTFAKLSEIPVVDMAEKYSYAESIIHTQYVIARRIMREQT